MGGIRDHDPCARRPGRPAEGGRSEMLRRLRLKLAEMEQLVEGLERAADGERGVEAVGDDLGTRLAESEADRVMLAERLVEAEAQASRMMNLYVVTYQLHSTLQLEEVQAAIGEIAVDLLGAERYVLLMRDEASGPFRIVLARGIENQAPAHFADGLYDGGEALINRALDDGHLVVDPFEGSPIEAVVPFASQGVTVGALIVFDLFAHRTRPLAEDRELLDLLAAHAASALLVAQVYSVKNRKLRTLESLITLVGEA